MLPFKIRPIKIRTKPLKRRKALTLMEILVTVALTGLIASLAFGPIVYIVRQITEAEASYSDEAALRRAAMFMAQDVSASLRLASAPVRVISHEELGGRHNDTLIVASSAPTRQNLSAGSVVYRVVRPSLFMNNRQIPGLYRWILPGILPEDVVYGRLNAEDGQLVVPHVSEMNLSVFVPPDWVPYYLGGLPAGMRFILSRERGGEESERVEYVFAFPR